ILYKARLDEFNAAFTYGKKSCSSVGKVSHGLDQHLVNLKEPPVPKQILTQSELGARIMKFIIEGIIPLNEVENEGFVGLLEGLVGKLVIKNEPFSPKSCTWNIQTQKT
ncbi:Uncharacterized protein APZ42_000376, partial [Daphnia magna]